MWTIRGTANRLALLGIVLGAGGRGLLQWRTHRLVNIGYAF